MTTEVLDDGVGEEIIDDFGEGSSEAPIPMGVGGDLGGMQREASVEEIPGDYRGMQRMAHELGVAANGKTGDLRARLEAHLSPPADDTPIPGDEQIPPDASPADEGQPPVQAPVGDGGTEQPQVTQEPETPDFHPAALRMMGFATAEQAQQAGFDTPDALNTTLQWHAQRLSSAPQQAQPQPFQPRPQMPPMQAAQQAPPIQAAQPTAPQLQPEAAKQVGFNQPQTAFEFQPFEMPEEDEFDEVTRNLIEAQNKHYQQQMQAALQSVAPQLQQIQRSQQMQAMERATQANNEYTARFDKAIEALGSEWEDVFGKGTGPELSRTGNHDPAAMTAINHRIMLASQVEALREANQRQGYQTQDLDQEINWALMQRYPDKFNNMLRQQSRTETTERVNGRRGVQAHRPTARKTPLAGRNERTLSAVDTMLRKKGRPGLDYGTEEEFSGEI